MSDLESIWEDGDPEDATPWLIEYVRVRLAEHYPAISAAVPHASLLFIVPLVLDGLTRCPSASSFVPHIQFDEDDDAV